jgi:hypothetical protein
LIGVMGKSSEEANLDYVAKPEREDWREQTAFPNAQARGRGKMNFETLSLLLNWLQMGALLAILFRLGRTFELIASTQCELRRAIHHLGEGRAAEPGIDNAFDGPGIALASRSRVRMPVSENTIGTDDPARLSPGFNP